MQFSLSAFTFSALAFTLASQVAATITGFSGPSDAVSVGQEFNVTFTTSVSSSNNEQYYALFGLTSGTLYANTIGSEPVANVDITNIPRERFSFNVPVTLSNVEPTASEQTLAVAVFGQVGASGGITLQYFNTTLNIVL